MISANGMREVITETRAKFEQASGHRLTITVVETGEIRRRVLGGEQYDVIMVPKAVADDFEKQGKMAPGSGVMYGDGDVWLSPICIDDACVTPE